MKIYWANSIFNEADRKFNTACVKRLRKEGYVLLNPQENEFNNTNSKCDSSEIFSKDTEMINDSDVFIACIDQESIDSGVACELGIAWSLDKKIFGLYTDFRQFRIGEGKMYKNPYVIGCIEGKGKIFSNINNLIVELRNVRNHL